MVEWLESRTREIGGDIMKKKVKKIRNWVFLAMVGRKAPKMKDRRSSKGGGKNKMSDILKDHD